MDDNSEEEEDEHWTVPMATCITKKKPTPQKSNAHSPSPIKKSPAENDLYESEYGHSRTIVQIDVDCFYAQVEMIRNPTLRDKPLGIQQKYIVVTCNYKAREYGVTKLMSLKDAKEKCPQLTLVSGEDLTHYRAMSYKITEVLQQFSCDVERLGFDENFLDISSLVDARLKHHREDGIKERVEGYIYQPPHLDNQSGENTDTPKGQCRCGCHSRLAVGSHIASEIRQKLFEELEITCCAGIAHNKLLAKLVGAVNKPNKQTTLWPEDTLVFMANLGHVGKIPGIGYSSAKKLSGLGIQTITDLRNSSLDVLLTEFEESQSIKMKQLSSGVDDSQVKLTGMPQSISDEDSFKRCSTEKEAREKILQLLDNLLIRLSEDGRTPQTARLTIRKFTTINKYSNRESRQCSIPSHLFSNFSPESYHRVKSKLCEILMPLFHKMVDVKKDFHLTLINVCFAKFVNNSKNTIASFFGSANSVSPKTSNLERNKRKSYEMADVCENSDVSKTSRKRLLLEPEKQMLKKTQSEENRFENLQTEENLENSGASALIKAPPGVEESIFRSLPIDIQKELSKNGITDQQQVLSETGFQEKSSKVVITSKQNLVKGQQSLKNFCKKVTPKPPHCSSSKDPFLTSENTCPNIPSTSGTVNFTEPKTSVQNRTETVLDSSIESSSISSNETSSDILSNEIPPNIDKDVFISLPKEVQEELFLDWRHKRTKSKPSPDVNTKKFGILQFYVKK